MLLAGGYAALPHDESAEDEDDDLIAPQLGLYAPCLSLKRTFMPTSLNTADRRSRCVGPVNSRPRVIAARKERSACTPRSTTDTPAPRWWQRSSF
jgi:hypothetical protein